MFMCVLMREQEDFFEKDPIEMRHPKAISRSPLGGMSREKKKELKYTA